MMIGEPICSGIDLRRLQFCSPEHHPPLIVAAARLDATSLSDLVEACRILVRRHCAFRCELFGEGCYESEWRTLAEGIGLTRHLQFMGKLGSLQWRDSLARASVFVAVSDRNLADITPSILTALHQAMALGAPCLVTDNLPVSELIQDGETGLIEPSHHPSAVAIALQRLFVDSSLRVRLAREARYLIEAKFDLDVAQEAC
jgi:glycosyltransferase involved in cell wall biosynthesis